LGGGERIGRIVKTWGGNILFFILKMPTWDRKEKGWENGIRTLFHIAGAGERGRKRT